MRKRRIAQSLSQIDAAKSTQMKPERWSQIERGYRTPSNSEVSRIFRLLGPFVGFVPPRKAVLHLMRNGERLRSVPKPMFTRGDRPAFVRFRACSKRRPEITSKLVSMISRRPDYELCHFICHQIVSDSYLETLNLLNMLARGAKPCLIAPAALHRLPLKLVEPPGLDCSAHRPQPCLVLRGEFYFFQVSLLTGEGVLRVDMLCWTSTDWRAIELNGSGHVDVRDSERSGLLELPIHWYGEQDIVESATRTVRNSERIEAA